MYITMILTSVKKSLGFDVVIGIPLPARSHADKKHEAMDIVDEKWEVFTGQ